MKTVSKPFEKAPINYPFVRHLSVLDPRGLIRSKEASVKKLTSVLQILVESSHIHKRSCDEVLKEFSKFYDHRLTSDSFRSFNPDSNRLDEFDHKHLSTKAERYHLWEIVKHLLILSHSQASVERCFSVNKEVLVENMHTRLLVAQ